MHWPSNVKIDVLERLTCVKDVNTVNSSILVKVSKMSLPGNGIFVVRGEMCTLMTAMRRGARWSSHSHQDDDEPLMRNFQELKEILNKVDDLRLVQPSIYLSPFLEVIRSEETTGPVTSLALSAVNKFLSYGLIGKCSL
jgi:brefeldin A-resistance guanine nucleotide exchange factor 1